MSSYLLATDAARDSRTLVRLAIGTVAAATGMVGAILIAANLDVVIWGYVLFLISSSATLVLLWNDKGHRPLLALNIFYVGVNIFGIIRW